MQLVLATCFLLFAATLGPAAGMSYSFIMFNLVQKVTIPFNVKVDLMTGVEKEILIRKYIFWKLKYFK